MSIVLTLDDYDVNGFCDLTRRRNSERYDYVVTPNVDHIIRYHDDPKFRELYADASYVLLDSRIVVRMLAITRRQHVRVCAGSDLTQSLFSEVIQPTDRVVLVGCRAQQAEILRGKYQLRDLRHIDVPMGFIRDAAAVEACLCAIEAASPFRFCFLAIGSPQQEIIAQQLKQRGRSVGMALCIGGSINFITGDERRAPGWLQRLSLEWLFRLLQDPRRLAKRYLVRGPRIFALWPRLRLTLRRVNRPADPLRVVTATISE
jgi:N-acetylglucosaminyldiphosphoundecaprenol N-acetyl-beta-D-mannosaminyltransferase